MSDVLVSCENVGKKFCRDLKKSLWYGVVDSASDLFSNRLRESEGEEPELRKGEFWANKDISFELRRGECLGLIGGNGAGKTTLLKMINGLIKPDSGRIEMKGRVGALIALGAGFNPILTGRENIYVNGSVLGFSRTEIKQRLDEIVAFAEIDDFIDAPVRTYSSGMQVRLGFAVAVAMDPDVLIIDEVLAVGDAAFKVKCINTIAERLEMTAVLFVSHNELQIRRICNLALHLKKGRQKLLSKDVQKALLGYNEETYCSSGTQWIGENLKVEGFSIEFPWQSSDRSNTGSKPSKSYFSLTIKSGLEKSRARICIMLLNYSDEQVFAYQSELCELVLGKNELRFESCAEVSAFGRFRVNLVVLSENNQILLRGTEIDVVEANDENFTKSPVFVGMDKACPHFC